jgi:hypothetical protein
MALLTRNPVAGGDRAPNSFRWAAEQSANIRDCLRFQGRIIARLRLSFRAEPMRERQQ